ncbi:uncharacterized protein LOC122390888 [Amphibalanus amphitrite]|uniref:uncharacterized protein LOC122390888 n=1 Tax=Amphibalanus amphitrite TaxID=1232801 RepID=UPI001C90D9FA|nr:uncharacterized protein LOC122390888 [Amphibalanus amphitrite]
MGNEKETCDGSDAAADLRLIPEFDGVLQPVCEWLDKVELVCQLRGIKGLHVVVPLRLTGGAFAVYQQLGEDEKKKYEDIKRALTSAFASDRFEAYDQFERRRLRPGETVDVFVSELRRLAGLFGGMPDDSLACAFVAKLPDSARHLRDAYLQIHVHASLWPYQTVVFQGRRWCLSRLGFGLSLAPMVMRKVLEMALKRDPRVHTATSPYVDDILVNENIATALEVKGHLEALGLTCKSPEKVSEGARVLGIRVWGERQGLFWKRDNQDLQPPPKLTRREVFSLCGRLTSQVPVCGWLRVSASYLKRRATAATDGWDDEITDPELQKMVMETLQRVKTADPARGRWDVTGDEGVVWVDASSLAIGAVLEMEGSIVEDACWLRKNPETHVNLAELDSVVRGINLSLAWNLKKVTVVTDSKTVYHWLTDALSGRARIKTKAASEMLIRRRLETVKSLRDEYGLQLTVKCVPSVDNRADALTRVPKKWLNQQSDPEVCGAAFSAPDVVRIHETSGHPGIGRTLRLCREHDPAVSRHQVRSVVSQCEKCQSIDPAPQRWTHGSLSVTKCWDRVSMDVCHVNDQLYLTLIDCGPSRYAIWRRIKRQDTDSIITALESVFLERGAPRELLTDNFTSFRSAAFHEFVSRWGVSVRYRAAHAPFGNGVSERNHRSVKTIVARKGCSVAEAVYRYNVMPRSVDLNSSPANVLFNYKLRVPDVESEEKCEENPPAAPAVSGGAVG